MVEDEEIETVKSPTFGNDLPLSRGEQQSPDLNPLYPECSIENNASYEDYSATIAENVTQPVTENVTQPLPEDVNQPSTEDSTQPLTEDVTQPLPDEITQPSSVEPDDVNLSFVEDDENSNPEKIELVSDEVIAQETKPDSVVEVNDMAQSVVVSAVLRAQEIVAEHSESPRKDLQSTSDVSTGTIQVPEKEVLDSDNSEAYLTPTEPNEAEKKTCSEGEAVKIESPSDGVEDEEAPQCNGLVKENCEDNADENASFAPSEVVEKSESADDQISVTQDETKSQAVPKVCEVKDQLESDLPSESQVFEPNFSEPSLPIHTTEIIESVDTGEEELLENASSERIDDPQVETASETGTKVTDCCEQPEASIENGWYFPKP